MKYENIFYRTSDGLLDIEFLFLDLGAVLGWRAYILTDINYKMFSRSRSDSCSIIHRLTESNSEYKAAVNSFISMTRQTNVSNISPKYICWSETVHDLSTMKTIAQVWSELTAYYVRNGGTFATIQPILSRSGIIPS